MENINSEKIILTPDDFVDVQFETYSLYIMKHPIIQELTWLDAINLCNYLTKKYYKPSDECVYSDQNEIVGHINFSKKGFRLPTYSELEYAINNDKISPAANSEWCTDWKIFTESFSNRI